MIVALAARASFHIVLEVAVLSRSFFDGIGYGWRKRRAAEISVQNYARGVNYRLEGGTQDSIGFGGDQFFDGRDIERAGGDRCSAGDLRTQFTQNISQQRDEQIAIHAARKGSKPGA